MLKSIEGVYRNGKIEIFEEPADIEEVLGFHAELVGPRPDPARIERRRRRSTYAGRRHKPR